MRVLPLPMLPNINTKAMANNGSKTASMLSKHMIQLIFFLVGMGCVNSVGFGFYIYRTLPDVVEDLGVLQKKHDVLSLEFGVMSTHMPRAHVSWREYDADIELMKEAREKMDREIEELIDIRELIRVLGRQP